MISLPHGLIADQSLDAAFRKQIAIEIRGHHIETAFRPVLQDIGTKQFQAIGPCSDEHLLSQPERRSHQNRKPRTLLAPSRKAAIARIPVPVPASRNSQSPVFGAISANSRRHPAVVACSPVPKARLAGM